MILESILASIQWDTWKFYLSSKQLLNQNIAVVSHEHLDHWGANFSELDTVLVPEGIKVPEQFGRAKNIVYVDNFFKTKKLVFTHFGPKTLGRFLKEQLFGTHSRWWLVRYSNYRVLFVGDLDRADILTLENFVMKAMKMGKALSAVLLPSYGLTNEHGTGIRKALFEVADKLRSTGIKIGGLPHPIDAPWADWNAVRSRSLADELNFDIQKSKF